MCCTEGPGRASLPQPVEHVAVVVHLLPRAAGQLSLDDRLLPSFEIDRQHHLLAPGVANERPPPLPS